MKKLLTCYDKSHNIKTTISMRHFITYLFSVFILTTSCDSTLTGEKLLDKAISYHDPNNNWSSFNGSFTVTMETPNRSNRISDISINLSEDIFELTATRDTITTRYLLGKNTCEFSFNGDKNVSDSIAKAHNLSCERGEMYKNYYSYLYGLPMKLKDPGTIIDEVVETKNFKGKDYVVLKATYNEEVGTDIWYFYFDPETYAMEIYQFFRQDENGNQKDDTGEYILLTDEETINGIKMPKTRAWYYNKDDKYLGTDILN